MLGLGDCFGMKGGTGGLELMFVSHIPYPFYSQLCHVYMTMASVPNTCVGWLARIQRWPGLLWPVLGVPLSVDFGTATLPLTARSDVGVGECMALV